MSRFARTLQSFRSIASTKTLTLPPFRSFEHHICELSEGHTLKSTTGTYIPALLAGLFGVGLIDVAYADANEINANNPLPSKTPLTPEYSELEEIARKERLRLEELLRQKGAHQGFCPRFTISVKGQKVTIRFQIPPGCEIPRLISNIVSNLGVADNHGAGSNMILRAWDSGVAWQLTLSRPPKRDETVSSQTQNKEINGDNEDLCILMFRPLINSDRAELEFMKQGSLTEEELEALASVLQLAGEQKHTELRPRSAPQVPSAEKTISSLEAIGVKIFGVEETNFDSSKTEITWDNIAGYNQQKREIEDTILLALQSPEVYDDIARGTRCKFETNRPRAVLFEGPPGTGKTSSARVIANQAGVPLVYVPLEVIMSKYYGESERMLGKIFSLVNELPNGAIVFLDEVDSLAVARDGETHEATRRLLSVLLRQIDGFEQERKVIVVAATNRKQDLDPALISRFDAMINFGLPDAKTRQEIAAQYAKHLTKPELAKLAAATEEMSGRDIRDVCQQAERHWASKIIRGQAQEDEKHGSLPPLKEYIDSATSRRQAMLSLREHAQYPRATARKPLLDFQ